MSIKPVGQSPTPMPAVKNTAMPAKVAGPAPISTPDTADFKSTGTSVAQPAVMAKKPVEIDSAKPWTVGRIVKTVGSGVAGYVGGYLGTSVADIFFHLGNNGGTAWPLGIYVTAASVVALGIMALYARRSGKD